MCPRADSFAVMVPHVWLCWPQQPFSPRWRLSEHADGVSSQEKSLFQLARASIHSGHTELVQEGGSSSSSSSWGELQLISSQDFCWCWLITCHWIGYNSCASPHIRAEAVYLEGKPAALLLLLLSVFASEILLYIGDFVANACTVLESHSHISVSRNVGPILEGLSDTLSYLIYIFSRFSRSWTLYKTAVLTPQSLG